MNQSLVQKQFGVAAADYAASSVHAKGPSLERLVAVVDPKPEWHALDIATGAGHTALAFAPLVKRVVASDITDEMLAEAAKLAAARGLANVETARAEAGALPFADQSFDLVTCRLAAHHFPDPNAFVGESFRVLRPGGTFALVDNVSPDASMLPLATPAELLNAARAFNTYEKTRDPSHARALPLSEWEGLMKKAGFSVASTELLDQDIAFGPWTERMRCTPETVEVLKSMLHNDVLLRTFLRPREENGALTFTLQEAIVVAKRPAQS
ncbi:MAG: class I SAM-dependent methyltransferase [Hyphomicrobium sp.]|jgi:ubiquinone/menaquinone biosynthesis C-methylase UbiE